MPLFHSGMYAGLVVCYWAVTVAILFALGPGFFGGRVGYFFPWRSGAQGR